MPNICPGNVEQMNSDEILMICDSTAHRFKMENCTTVVLEPNEGLEELVHKMHPELPGDELGHDISTFKLVILMTGRADFHLPTLSFTIKWFGVMEVIRQFYPGITVLVTPPLISLGDSVDMRVKEQERSEFLLYYAHEYLKIQFARPQKFFWREDTPIELYYDNLGNLTELGVAAIRSQLMHKIQLFNLLDV